MKKLVSIIAFTMTCLLFAVSNSQAITIDYQNRHVTLFQTINQSNAAGDFTQGLSWVNGNFDTPYNSSRGYDGYGALGYQESSITNNSTTMTLGGLGNYRVWLPNTENIDVTIISRFELLFRPMTGATYTFWTNNDGGTVTFKDMTDNTEIYDGSGSLIADRQYQILADVSISALYDPNFGLNSGGYWLFGLEVNEVPSNAPVPEPSTMLLIVSGLVGIVAFGKKRMKA